VSRSFATLIDSGRLAHVWPFAAIAAAGQISAIWPPGPSNHGLFWWSTALLLLSALLLFVRLPVGVSPLLLAAAADVLAVTFLLLATGGTESGFAPLYLIPVVGLALFGRRRGSVIVVALVLLGLFVVSIQGGEAAMATARRLGLVAGISCVLSVSIHALRLRLTQSKRHSERLLHQAESINAAARRLSSLLEPPAIAALGAELAAQTASSPGGPPAAARFLRLERRTVTVEARSGPDAGEDSWPLDQRSPLADVVRDLRPLTQSARGAPDDGNGSPDPTWHTLLIPVAPGGRLHGVLEIVSLDAALTDDSLERSIALGHLLELALSNWAAHQQLEQAGRAEERRRIARDLHDGLAHELAYIASMARSSRRAKANVDAAELSSAADRALDEARRAITVLSSAAPQSLAGAVAQTAEDLGARLGVAVHLEVAEGIDTRPDVTEHVLRIVREAITNAATHGGPSVVTVTVRKDDGVRVVIADDGCGFDPEMGARSGFGLVSMRERADAIGAGFVVASAPSLGTRIELALP
jgi:signal transduction histidine kinase